MASHQSAGFAATKSKDLTSSLAGVASEKRQLLKRTQSRCPVCKRACPGAVWRIEGSPASIVLQRRCPEHGEFSACIASDARFYWLANGKPENSAGERDSIHPATLRGLDFSGKAVRASNGAVAGVLGRNA